MLQAFRIVQRNALVYRRTWRGSIFTGFLQPALFLLALGVGVGSFVDAGGTSLPGGVTFLQFLAPGLLAGACMQTATFESSWPIVSRMTWQRNYEAISATPINVAALVTGELAWLAVRLTTIATSFAIVTAFFRVPQSRLAVLAVPAAVLTGLAFAAPIMAYAATRKTSANFNVLFRFFITPLFLFSGTFFPITRLPRPLQVVAELTPLYHGVALTRGLMLGGGNASAWLLHTGYLSALVLAGTAIGIKTFAWKLRS